MQLEQVTSKAAKVLQREQVGAGSWVGDIDFDDWAPEYDKDRLRIIPDDPKFTKEMRREEFINSNEAFGIEMMLAKDCVLRKLDTWRFNRKMYKDIPKELKL